MAEHFTRNTESATRYCGKCGQYTQHGVSDGRIGRCLEHDAPKFSKKQLADQKRREHQADKPKGLFE